MLAESVASGLLTESTNTLQINANPNLLQRGHRTEFEANRGNTGFQMDSPRKPVLPAASWLSENVNQDAKRGPQEKPKSPTPSCLSMKSEASIIQPTNFKEEPKRDPQEKPRSPTPSCLSMRSDVSIIQPTNFKEEPKRDPQEKPRSPTPSCLSMKSDVSIIQPTNFKEEPKRDPQEKPRSPTPSCLSMKSDVSIIQPTNFKEEPKRDPQEKPRSPTPSCLSMKSNASIIQPTNFKEEPKRDQQEKPRSPTPSCLSMKSNASIIQPTNFKENPKSEPVSVLPEDQQCTRCEEKVKGLVSIPCGHKYCRQCLFTVCSAPYEQGQEHWCAGPEESACDFCFGRKLKAVKSCRTCPALLCVNHALLHNKIPTLRTHVLEECEDWKQRHCHLHHRALDIFCKTDQTHICKFCAMEEHKNHSVVYKKISEVADIPSLLKLKVSNMKTEDFMNFKKEVITDYPACFGDQQLDLDVTAVVKKMLESFGDQEALMITLQFLDVGKSLKNVKEVTQAKLGRKFQSISEGLPQQGPRRLLDEIYTELYITEGGGGQVSDEHEVRHIEMASKTQIAAETSIDCNNIFEMQSGEQRPHIRTVLTKGIAGIGKTVSVQKFILDWANGKENEDIMVIVPLSFRDLNLKKEDWSLIQLLHHYNPELTEIKDIEDDKVKILLIFDGLDECRFHLDFQKNENFHDVKRTSPVNVLLTNLIKGNLLPSALLWITCRPAAANQIPAEYIDRITEIRGFTELQKEEYLRKRISNTDLASKIITHIKSTRSLFIMCHIPVFCWLSATVLENMMTASCNGGIPKTLTEMYTHFLLIQTGIKNKKYNGDTVENPMRLSQSDKEVVLKLAELAFQQLEKGNLIFYQDDLKNCGIDVSKAEEYSSLCTQIFKEDFGLYKERVFCFVHLSIQEHLAAIHAHITCVNNNRNIFKKKETKTRAHKLLLSDLHQSAVDKALQSKNGHLDLFLRFLLGLSVDSNQTLLEDLMTQGNTGKIDLTSTTLYIKEKIKTEASPDRVINLLHCLSELNDGCLLEEVQTALSSGTLSEKEMKPDQCSALAYILTTSKDVFDEFDFKTYKTSATGSRRLLPVLRTCRRASFTRCFLSSESCETVASALKTVSSPLTELDLSNNNLTDSGVRMICAGLTSPNSKLQKLRLVECNLTAVCGADLASALRSSHSTLKELELSYNNLQDSGVDLLSTGLGHQHCNLEKLWLSVCSLTDSCCLSLSSVLRSPHCNLRELDLQQNNLQDSGVKLLSDGLVDPLCKLERLGLEDCHLTEGSCKDLASVLRLSHLRELELRSNSLGDSGVRILFAELKDQHCTLDKLGLADCGLTGDCCAGLASALQLPHTLLRELDLSDNDLGDSGVALLSAGPLRNLEKLGLQGCLITDKGCASLASSLRSNLSHLQDLNLSYNHPGDKGKEALEDPQNKLKNLNLDHGGACRMKPGMKKYSRQLTLNLNTVHRNLALSEENRRVTHTLVEQPYPDHPERCKFHLMAVCTEPLSERCYWELEWTGRAEFGVICKRANGDSEVNKEYIGMDTLSFTLVCHGDRFFFLHNSTPSAEISPPHPTDRLRVYLDWDAGTVSYYSIFHESVTHLFTFHTILTQPVYAVIEVYADSSATLCVLE